MRYWSRDFRLLACGVFGVGAFFGILYPLFNNFIVDQIGIQPHELGYMESLREVPGFLNALFTAVIIYLAPPIVAGLALVVMGIGMASYSQVNSFYGILVFSFVWSIGFHAWLPLRSAMTLAYSADEEKGKWFGQLRSVESLATLAMIGLCFFATNLIEFEGLFQIGGGVVTAGGIALLFASRRLQTERENRFVLRKKYWLYYLLSLIDGSRRQIFTTFAIFALVMVFGTDRGVIIKLVLINQVVVLFFSPMIGRLVDTRGERTMLSISYVGLFFVFIGYAILRKRHTSVCALLHRQFPVCWSDCFNDLLKQDCAATGPQANACHGRYNESRCRGERTTHRRFGVGIIWLSNYLYWRRCFYFDFADLYAVDEGNRRLW